MQNAPTLFERFASSRLGLADSSLSFLPRFACQTTFAAQSVRRKPCGRFQTPIEIRLIKNYTTLTNLNARFVRFFSTAKIGRDRRLLSYLPDAQPALRQAGAAGRYILAFRTKGSLVEIELDEARLLALGEYCRPLLLAPEPPPVQPEIDDELREQAMFVKELSDQAIQLLLRELQSDLLIIFLWYMKDAELIRKVMHNCSERAAAMLMEDMVSRKEGQDPDQSSVDQLEDGRLAARTVLQTIKHLVRKANATPMKEGES